MDEFLCALIEEIQISGCFIPDVSFLIRDQSGQGVTTSFKKNKTVFFVCRLIIDEMTGSVVKFAKTCRRANPEIAHAIFLKCCKFFAINAILVFCVMLKNVKTVFWDIVPYYRSAPF